MSFQSQTSKDHPSGKSENARKRALEDFLPWPVRRSFSVVRFALGMSVTASGLLLAIKEAARII